MNVTLNCISSDNVVKIEWTKDGIQVFVWGKLGKNKTKTTTNFSSERMSVDPATPMILQISDVQESDEGIYTCTFIDKIKTKWNLTISSGNPDTPKSIYIYIYTAAISGTIFLIIIIIAYYPFWGLGRKQEFSKHLGPELTSQAVPKCSPFSWRLPPSLYARCFAADLSFFSLGDST